MAALIETHAWTESHTHVHHHQSLPGFSANLFLFYKALPAVLVMAIPVVVLNSLTVAFVCSRLLNYGDGWDFSVGDTYLDREHTCVHKRR